MQRHPKPCRISKFARLCPMVFVLLLAFGPLAPTARGQDAPIPPPASEAKPYSSPLKDLGLDAHLQATWVEQGNFKFKSPYQGPNSLPGKSVGRQTFDLTLYLGKSLWTGAEIWINPELDQGFGLGNTLGLAGFSSGEAYKVGKKDPYLKWPRYFFRQTLNLGGADDPQEADLNQVAMARTADRVVITLGKFGVGDIFDTNRYAHDPRVDFLNWSVINAGSFDYAADAWGFTTGAAAELYKDRFTFRLGVFNLSTVPNSEKLDWGFKQYQVIGEVEARHTLFQRPGKVKLTAFSSHGRMGWFDEAVTLSRLTGRPVQTAEVRRFQSKSGYSLNLEQEMGEDWGLFARIGAGDGKVEAFDFTDIDRTVSLGASFSGKSWGRPQDRVGIAGVVNDISAGHKAYQAQGGLGILIGDGRLPNPGKEQILEIYYDLPLLKTVHLSLDAQHIINPAYNKDRGPVDIVSARLHFQY